MPEQPTTGIEILREPVWVDPALTWVKGMGIKPVPSPTFQPIPTMFKPLIVDIESTGANPWDSRLICIGYKDPMRPASEPEVILHESEEQILLDFLRVFVTGGYDQIIAYNTAFDFRYIFAKCLYYRISCSEWVAADLYDIMQILTQVKQAFVYGYLKSGKLEDWMFFLLGKKKPLTFRQILTLYDEKNYGPIIEYNKNDVETEFILYALIELVKEQNFTGSSFAIPTSSPSSDPNPEGHSAMTGKPPQQTWNARCPICYSVYERPMSETEYICPIDRTKIKQGG